MSPSKRARLRQAAQTAGLRSHLNTLQSEKEEEEEEEAGQRQDLRGHALLQTRLFLRHTQRFGTGKRRAGGANICTSNTLATH
jgi:hypothetical protein